MHQRASIIVFCVVLAAQMMIPVRIDSAVNTATLSPTTLHHDVISVENITSLQPFLKIGHPDTRVWDVVWSLNGNRLAVITRNYGGYGGGQVRVFNIDGATKSNVSSLLLEDHDNLKCAAFNPTGTVIASCDANGNIQLKSATNGQTQQTISLGDKFKASSTVFSPDGALLAVGTWSSGVVLWDVGSGKPKFFLHGPVNIIHSVAFSPNGKFIAASAATEHSVVVWNTSTGEISNTFAAPNTAGRETKKVEFSYDGRYLVMSDVWAGNTSIWEVSSGKRLLFLERAWGITFSPRDLWFAYSTSRFGDGAIWTPWRIILHNLTTGQEQTILGGPQSVILAMALSPDGSRLAFAEEDGSVTIVDIDGTHRKTIVQGVQNYIGAIAFSADTSSFVTTGLRDGTAFLWDTSTGHGLETWSCCVKNVTSSVLSPDRKTWAYSMFDGEDDLGPHRIHLVNTATGQERSTLTHPNDLPGENYIFSLAFSPDSRLLASAGVSGEILLWNAASGGLVGVLKGHSYVITRLIFSPDNSLLLSVSRDGTIRSWDIKTLNQLVNLKAAVDSGGNDNVVAIAPNNTLVASTSKDKTIHLWDARTGNAVSDIEGEPEFLNDLAFSPDGKLLAGVSWQYALKAWDVSSGKVIFLSNTNEPGATGATALAFSPDGQLLVTGHTGMIWEWRLSNP